jgi:hypothetical protein
MTFANKRRMIKRYMANSVFARALDGLTTMVSARAARRVLEAGVRSVAETPDTIPADVMQTLLVGYVHREFEQMLPREGLKRNLEQLARQVGRLSVTSPKVGLPNPYDSSEVDAVTAALSYFTRVNIDNTSLTTNLDSGPDSNASSEFIDVSADVPQVEDSQVEDLQVQDLQVQDRQQLAFAERATSTISTENSVNRSTIDSPMNKGNQGAAKNHARAPDKQVSAPQAHKSQARQSTSPSVQPAAPKMWQDQFDVSAKADKLKHITPKGAPMADSTETKLILSEAQLENIVMRFAQVEHARLVAAVRENGTIVTSRGAGVDLNSLSRFGLMGLRLLERSGHLRSYYLSHTQGQLFLFCFGRDTVIMLGSSDINVGTVFATLTSLKDNP